MLLTKIKTSISAAVAAFCINTSVDAISVSAYGYPAFFPSDVDKFLHVHSAHSPFIKNQGQADSRISFYRSTGTGIALVTTSGELLYTISRQERNITNKKFSSFRVRFKGGKAQPAGRAKYSPLVNFYLGNEIRKNKPNLPIYDTVALGEVWPGIDVSLHAGVGPVGKHFAVQPGGDVSSIQIQVSHAEKLKILSDGELAVFTSSGPVTFNRPNAYQISNGKKVFVSIAYQVDRLTYGFKVKNYDPGKSLFIDPLTLDDSKHD